ncbi:MAG: phosphotransferase enzyme family protein [Anaerolineae bacterium]
MKPYHELTRLGRIRRMRRLAEAALTAFGIAEARFKLLRQAGNTLFRVYTPVLGDKTAGELFEPGQYMLRVHEPGYQEPEAIELELAWLSAMRQDADLPVPEPVPTLDGHLLLPVSMPGIPQTRNCSLLRWVKGYSVHHRCQPYHLRAQGRLLARLHNFAAQWHPPEGSIKRQFDWDGLFQNDVGSGMPNAEAWALLSPVHQEAFDFVAQRVREVMDVWGKGPDVYGLIHGDLGIDANLLFWRREPRAIDFDDSGFGYWIFDLAVGLDFCWDDAVFPRYQEALLNGYTELRILPKEQVEQLELFLAALQVYWNLWATGGTHLYPDLYQYFDERIAHTAERVVHYARRAR